MTPQDQPPAPTLRALIEQWRYIARQTLDTSRSEVYAGCADDLEAALTETDGPAPQKDEQP